MADTFTQLYIQIIFSVQNRGCVISREHREEVQKYITGIVTSLNQKMMAIFCMPDHLHMLISFRPNMAISELVNKVKSNSSKFIKHKDWMRGNFAWQEGYGAFSYSQSDVKDVIHYILHQEEHHQKKSFQEEYHQFLEKFQVEYKEEYVFDLR